MELLSPVGDFECLKAAVQNGADAVYFGGSLFNARMSSTNFGEDSLKQAIEYARVRRVKTYLTLNTLIKPQEFNQAVELAKQSYREGIDSIIVQDLGLAKYLIDNFPELPIHGSTQMTIHNLEGAKELESLGFKRVVLSRELSLEETQNICSNSNIEVETFIHGALCMSYSGQCLMSSMIGGRSGNRGRCAGTCRLPYSLQENEQTIKRGYLLSPRDLCGLEYLPNLIKAGVKCGKIEGRMKTPEYVATVTRIYRKYIDLAKDETKQYVIEQQDKKDLIQIFNRGSNGVGHFDKEPNRNFVFNEKPGNTGIYLGEVLNHNNTNGYIKVKLENVIAISDTIEIGNDKYNVSEIVENNKNVKAPYVGQIVQLGRVKGNIRVGDKVYRLSSKELLRSALESFNGENKRIELNCTIIIKLGEKIEMVVESQGLEVTYKSDIIPDTAKNAPVTEEAILKQISKTGNTPYTFRNINIDLDDNIFLPNSNLNDIRREALKLFENTVIQNSKRYQPLELNEAKLDNESDEIKEKKVAVLLNKIDANEDYTKLENIDYLYLPLHYFLQDKYTEALQDICAKQNVYIYMPIIMNEGYIKVVKNTIKDRIKDLKISGAVISNLGEMELFKEIIEKNKLEVIANYSMNVFNGETIKSLKELGISRVTISPELNLRDIENISNKELDLEQIVYGRQALMTTKYCFVGDSNKCYKDCNRNCEKNSYKLKDRMNFVFPVVSNRIENTTTVLNSKITSILGADNISTIRIDVRGRGS